MKLNKTTKRIGSFLVFAVLFSFHLCACEEALAAAESASHADAGCAHHESKDSHEDDHGSKKGEDASCCADWVAVQSPAKLTVGLQPFNLPANFLENFKRTHFFADLFSSQTHPFELLPRGSPQDISLTSHFTHAPPLIF